MKGKFTKKTMVIAAAAAAVIMGGSAAAFGAWDQGYSRTHNGSGAGHYQMAGHYGGYNCYGTQGHHGYYMDGSHIHGHYQGGQAADQDSRDQAGAQVKDRGSENKN
ncbi:MAG: hypothetical protein MI863_19350 [Desulfobacterales bacterium]|nr:hypothetical protein [Desulfobacterales bacterium]